MGGRDLCWKDWGRTATMQATATDIRHAGLPARTTRGF
jgi:hypothetical protein